MTTPNLLYTIMLSAAAAISAGVVAMLWPRRRVAGARPVMLFMAALTWWGATYALFWLGVPAPTPFFWLDLTYVGVVIVPAALLAFSLEFTGRGDRLTAGVLWFLAIEPVMTLVLLWTDPWHGLFFGSQRTATSGAILTGGPAFWFNIIYSYTVILIACVVLIRAFLHSPVLYQRQALLVIVAVLIPWVSNFISLGGMSPFPGLDLTPLVFTVSGILLAVALTRFRFLDIAPVARDLLVENMSDGVLVLDNRQRIVDTNPAMQRMLAPHLADPIGKPLALLDGAWPALLAFSVSGFDREDDATGPVDAARFVDLQQLPIADRRGQRRGTLIIVRDVTARKVMQDERERLFAGMQDALAQVKTLRGLLHTCAQCKKVRDEHGDWLPLDLYVRTHTDAEFSHGLCPDCTRELYPDLFVLREEQKSAILAFLSVRDGSRLDELSDAIGMSKSSLLRRLESLILEERVTEADEDGAPIFRAAPAAD